MLSFDEPIETDRLVLRRFRREDFDALYEQQSSPELARYLTRGVRSREEVGQVLAQRIASTGVLAADGDRLALAVERREDGRVVGDLTLILNSAEWAQVEVGWVFGSDFQGQGYATEAARELVRLAFEGLDAHRVFGRADVLNEASTRLMERLGMRCEATFRENQIFKGDWCTEVVYAVLANEWRQQHAA